jgi:hypothetical protein
MLEVSYGVKSMLMYASRKNIQLIKMTDFAGQFLSKGETSNFLISLAGYFRLSFIVLNNHKIGCLTRMPRTINLMTQIRYKNNFFILNRQSQLQVSRKKRLIKVPCMRKNIFLKRLVFNVFLNNFYGIKRNYQFLVSRDDNHFNLRM